MSYPLFEAMERTRRRQEADAKIPEGDHVCYCGRKRSEHYAQPGVGSDVRLMCPGGYQQMTGGSFTR